MKMVLRVLSVLLVFLAAGSFAMAQEVTAVPDVPAEVFVVQPVEAPAPVAAAPAEELRVNLVTVIIGLLTAFAAGGIVGIAGLSVFVQRLQKDTQTVTALELLANSWPPQTRELLLSVSRGAKEIGALGEEVFDGKPLAAKLPQLE